MKNLLIVFAMLCCISGIAQKRFELQQHGVSFEEPADWLKTEDEKYIENAKKFEWSEEQRKNLENSRALKLVAFHKYNPRNYRGIIPTINLTINKIKVSSIAELKQVLTNSHKSFQQQLEKFTVLSALKEMPLQGGKALSYTASYTITAPDGTKVPLLTHSVDFMKGEYIYSITFVEEKGKENNVEIFNKLIASIKLD